MKKRVDKNRKANQHVFMLHLLQKHETTTSTLPRPTPPKSAVSSHDRKTEETQQVATVESNEGPTERQPVAGRGSGTSELNVLLPYI